MKQFFVFVILLMNLPAAGQNRFSVGVNFTPVFSKNVYNVVADSENFKGIVDFNQYDQWSLGWISGISGEYSINERAFLTIGLNFKRIKDIYYYGLPTYYRIPGDDGFVPFYSSHTFQTKTNLDFIILPVGLKYNLFKLGDKIALFLHPSFSPELLLNDNKSENQFSTKQAKANMCLNVALPLSFTLSKELNLIFSPQYSISVNPINQIKFNSVDFLIQRNQFVGLKMEVMYE